MISNLDQLIHTLNSSHGTWAWVGQRGLDAYTVNDFVPVEAVFCCDFGEQYSRLWSGESLFSVEKDFGKRENWGNHHLEKLWEEPIRKRIETFTSSAKAPIYTVCYRSLGALEIDRRFPVGSSGDNTYFIFNEVDFGEVGDILGTELRVKMSKYLPVPSLNGHCVILRTSEGLRAIAVCPSVQIVGIHGCTRRDEIYCGNDFAAAERVPKSVREEVCDIMEKIGLFMGRKGFLGIFGMDFLLNDDEILALEINPRFQGSTMMLSLLQMDRREIPVSALHVMQFMGLMEAFPQEYLEQLRRMYRIPYQGAHLIVHSLEDKSCSIEHDLKAGIYTLMDDAIEWVRDGTTYRNIKKSSEWCVLGNLPLKTTEIFQEARLAMLQTCDSILDSNLKELAPDAAAFVKVLQSRCRTIPFHGGSK
jgi:hypothetical protein